LLLVQLDINFTTGTGQFEILESNQVAASGKISIPEQSEIPEMSAEEAKRFPIKQQFALTGSEVYKELRLRGYEYGTNFR